jgi:hypothetical protein
MDEPKIIFKYQGRLNKLRDYEEYRKRIRKSQSLNWRLHMKEKRDKDA